jgi:hypothetical protein
MIGLGALTAGGSAAFGTEAFTSVEAQRNVDVYVAGDASAFVALTETDSDGTSEYVSSESDGTLQVNIDDENADVGGSGVNDDAITVFSNLFKILNQGSQTVSVYVEEESEAVTFQSGGNSIEKAEDAVELDVGEEIVVGIEVDTLNNDVDPGGEDGTDTLIDTATVYAEAESNGPSGPNPAEFDLLLDTALSGELAEDEFTSVSAALSAATEGDTIGVNPGTYQPGSTQTIDTKGVSLVGPNAGTHGGASRAEEATFEKTVEIAADDVTIDGVTFSGTEGNAINMKRPVSGVTIQNSRVLDVVETGFSDSGGEDVAADGINAQLSGDDIGQPGDTMANLAIRDNLIANFDISGSGDNDDEVTATGIRLNQKDKNVQDPVISGNVIRDLEASNGNDAGTIEVRGITINAGSSGSGTPVDGLTIDSNEIKDLLSAPKGSSTGIAIFEDFGSDPREGPTNFEITANEFGLIQRSTIGNTASEVSGSIFIGGYDDLGEDHRVENNNIRRGQVARFGESQDGFSPGEADALNVENNYWGASDGPGGNDGVGGGGAEANTVAKTPPSKLDNDLVAAADGGHRTSEVPFAGPDV